MKTDGRWKTASVFALRATPRQVAGMREERERGRRSEIGGQRSGGGDQGMDEDRWKMEDRFARTREERARGLEDQTLDDWMGKMIRMGRGQRVEGRENRGQRLEIRGQQLQVKSVVNSATSLIAVQMSSM